MILIIILLLVLFFITLLFYLVGDEIVLTYRQRKMYKQYLREIEYTQFKNR